MELAFGMYSLCTCGRKSCCCKQWSLRSKFLPSVPFQIPASREEESTKSERKSDHPLSSKNIPWPYCKHLNHVHYSFQSSCPQYVFGRNVCISWTVSPRTYKRRFCLLFCLWSKHHFTTCYMFIFTSSLRGSLKAKERRTKNVNILQKLTLWRLWLLLILPWWADSGDALFVLNNIDRTLRPFA